MLRSFEVSPAFRGMAEKPFTAIVPCVLGRFTLIYGRNGSGKTTFSELFRPKGSEPDLEPTVVSASLRIDGRNTSAQLSEGNSPFDVFVYNRYYVLDSLNLFLDGHGGSPPILKLGIANVLAQREIEHVRERLDASTRRRGGVLASIDAWRSNQNRLEGDVKQLVVAALERADPAKYNSTRYTVATARARLTSPDVVALDDSALLSEVELAVSPLLPEYPIDAVPTYRVELTAELNELLASTIDAEVVQVLAEDHELAAWVEEGVKLHPSPGHCRFCGSSAVTEDLLATYRRHFNAAMTTLRERLARASGFYQELGASVAAWRDGLLPTDQLLPPHRSNAETARSQLDVAVDGLVVQLSKAETTIRARISDPLTPIGSTLDPAVEIDFPSFEDLLRLIDANNADCAEQEVRKRSARLAVEGHYGALSAADYQSDSERVQRAQKTIELLDGQASNLRERLHVLEQSLDDTGAMAALIDEDLRDHFGYGHLKISVSEDRKGYVVQRGDHVAERLSEGERNAIALSYFLRSLEAEGVAHERSLVIVDDPVTSLDRESQFAAFSLAEERTKNFVQRIFLTHDFEYFRLLLNQRRNSLNRSRGAIEKGDLDEIAYPKVSVLEIVAVAGAGQGSKTSALRPIPDKLLQHPSEYHYLFYNVAQAVLGNRDEELPLLGNAARRLIEGFISFRAPQGNNFQEKIDSISRGGTPDRELASRVTKFLHGQSHRDEPRITAALDVPSIEHELGAVLNFVLQADPGHFELMSTAVGLDLEQLKSSMRA